MSGRRRREEDEVALESLTSTIIDGALESLTGAIIVTGAIYDGACKKGAS